MFVHRINLAGPRIEAHSFFFFFKFIVAVRTLCHWTVQLIYSNQFLLFPLHSPPSPAEGKKMCLIPI